MDKKLPSTWQEALSEFILFKQAQGASPRTVEDYEYHIRLLFTRYPDAWNPLNFKRAVLEHMAQPVAPATFNIRRKYLKVFFNWCMEEGIFPENPLSGVSKRRDEGRIRSVKQEVLERLLSLPNPKTFTGLRDYALILLSLDVGIRPKEALSLRVWDVDLEDLTITIRREISKTRKTSILPITRQVADALKRLIHARHPQWNKDAPLFCTRDGTPLTVRRWEARLRKYSDILGVNITPYDLRHSFATLFLKDGGHPFALQKILRHSSMDMVKRYVQLTEGDLREQHELASPVRKLLPKKPRVGRIQT
ncbi:MAG TPA: tyrosine-type recombinase/integrase [Firmicutes bacterium]|nr:tyrosine-type recombinase/integrase [Bacillota bacterium]